MSDDKIDKLIEQNKEILEELKSLREENKELREENKNLRDIIAKMQERQERLQSKLNKDDIEDLVATLYLQNRTKREMKEKLSDIDKRATDKYFESSYQKISNEPDYQRGRESYNANVKERAKEMDMPVNKFKDMQLIGKLYRLNHKKRVEAGLEPDTEFEQGDYDALEEWYEDYIEDDEREENPAW